MENKLSLKDQIALNNELGNLHNLIKKFIGCNHFDVYGILSPESNPSIPIHKSRIPSEDAYFEATLDDMELEDGFILLEDVSSEYPKWRFTEHDLLDLLEITIPESISKITSLSNGNFIATQTINNQLQTIIEELGDIIQLPKYVVYRDYLIDLLIATSDGLLPSNSSKSLNLKDKNEGRTKDLNEYSLTSRSIAMICYYLWTSKELIDTNKFINNNEWGITSGTIDKDFNIIKRAANERTSKRHRKNHFRDQFDATLRYLEDNQHLKALELATNEYSIFLRNNDLD